MPVERKAEKREGEGGGVDSCERRWVGGLRGPWRVLDRNLAMRRVRGVIWGAYLVSCGRYVVQLIQQHLLN